jgi:hypothetical protein
VEDDVIGAHSASELLRVGVPRRQVIICLTDELDLTEDQAEKALAVADTPIAGEVDLLASDGDRSDSDRSDANA